MSAADEISLIEPVPPLEVRQEIRIGADIRSAALDLGLALEIEDRMRRRADRPTLTGRRPADQALRRLPETPRLEQLGERPGGRLRARAGEHGEQGEGGLRFERVVDSMLADVPSVPAERRPLKRGLVSPAPRCYLRTTRIAPRDGSVQ